MLIVYGLSVITAFLAGATLVAHADPTSGMDYTPMVIGERLHHSNVFVFCFLAYTTELNFTREHLFLSYQLREAAIKIIL